MFKKKNKLHLPKRDFFEYYDGCDTEQIKKSLKKITRHLTLQLVLVTFLALIYVGVTFLNYNNILLFNFKFTSQVLLLSSIFILILSLIICPKVIYNGFLKSFTLNFCNETIISFAAIFAFIQNLFFLIFQEKYTSDTSIYIGLVLIFLIFNTISQLLTQKRIKRNFKFVLANRQKFSIELCEKENIPETVLSSLDLDKPITVTKQPISFINNFFESSYIMSTLENASLKLIPFTMLFSLIVGILNFIFKHDLIYSINSVLVILFMCAPTPFFLCISSQLSSSCKRSLKNGSMITNSTTIKNFSKVNSIVLDESDFYPANNVILREIKTFRGQRVDEAILSAATLVSASESTLSKVFDKIIMGEKKILNKASDVVFEEGRGISGWVNGKHTLIGNRELLKNYNIDPPSRDYENKYRKDGEGIAYIAIARELVAMFILEYKPNQKIKAKLANAPKNGIKILVKNIDANINRDRIVRDFGIPSDFISTVPFGENLSLSSPKHSQSTSDLATTGNSGSILSAVCTCKNAQNNFKLATAMFITALVIALSVIICLAFNFTLDQINEFEIFIYLFFWTASSLAATKIKSRF